MGTFDTFADSPFLINSEGESITLSFKQGVPATGQGTVSWNIPVPGVDCNSSADGRDGAYSGIVVLLSESPLLPNNMPVNGRVYVADATADPDLHAGDTIDGALVVGAFYEAEKKGRGEELTSSLVIGDIKAGKTYYVAAYAIDDQLRYHQEGVRAYSDKYSAATSPDTPSRHRVKLGTDGVLPSDGTGLTPGVFYDFDIVWDNSYPHRTNERVYRIRVDGMNAGTYADLVSALNKQFSMIENPPQSPVAPNTGKLYWADTTNILYEFDGDGLVVVPDVIKEPTDPAQVAAGEYWLKPSTNELFLASSSPTTWSAVNIIDYGPVDPRAFKGTDHWFGYADQAYVWGGSAWCEVPTVVDEVDPASVTMVNGQYWYDTVNNVLYAWNAVTCTWDVSGAMVWPTAPTALDDGTYWFDLATNSLFARQASPADWIAQTPLIISTTEPTAPAVGAFWFNSDTEVLSQYGGSGPSWMEIPVIVWSGDPTDVTSCELWWRSSDDELFIWDVVHSTWNVVVEFVQSATDPQLPPTVEVGTIWYKPTAGTILRWDGGAWQIVDVVVNATDPTIFVNGDAWYNESADEWYIWGTSPGVWNLIDPIGSEDDPTSISNGTYWFNLTTDLLYTRNGLSWIPTAYVTSPPLPRKGTLWFNLTENALYEWDGYKWIASTPIIIASIDSSGYLLFETREASSGMNLMILTPGTPGELGTGFAEFGYQEIPGSYRNSEPNFYETVITEEVFLFTNLSPQAQLYQHVYGADGLPSSPSYLEIGVGTDGTPEERRKLADTIRTQLGHPIVTVELDKTSMNTAINNALEAFRLRSSAAYVRGFYFLDIIPGVQEYTLTNKSIGYNKIVNVTSLRRFTSAFLSTSHGGGVYGQVVLQHLYNMGTYDLTSYHLISQYVEQLEHLFATRLTYQWHEQTRKLSLYNSFVYNEKILMDCTVERTEQELFQDRLTKNWIRRYALAEAMYMLANIRGKFGTLPGAGGGISLNASELITQADALKLELTGEIDDYVTQDPEDLGLNTTFIIG